MHFLQVGQPGAVELGLARLLVGLLAVCGGYSSSTLSNIIIHNYHYHYNNYNDNYNYQIFDNVLLEKADSLFLVTGTKNIGKVGVGPTGTCFLDMRSIEQLPIEDREDLHPLKN